MLVTVETVNGSHWLPLCKSVATINCLVAKILQNIFCCASSPNCEELVAIQMEERNLCRFGTTWGWENYDRFFTFWWTITLKLFVCWQQLVYMFEDGWHSKMHIINSERMQRRVCVEQLLLQNKLLWDTENKESWAVISINRAALIATH